VHTLQQLVDYLHSHGAPAALIDQVRSLQARHLLNTKAFQDLVNRFHWGPGSATLNDATDWVRHGIR
jgi:hypothetical protein